MKHALVLLVVGACIATPCRSEPERFTTDKPSPLKPLKPLKPGKDDGNRVRFSGSLQISGQFLIVWERKEQKTVYRQVTFFPDAGSAALLPHLAGSAPVQELFFSDREQAAKMLLDLPTVEKPLARERIGSEGAATITIRDYRTGVDCDQRWYMAQLVSAKKNRDMVVGARDARPGC
jgi:hypothetical protein